MTTIYPVNEVFESIQGEATYTGTPSVFIRLQGCPVGCSFCDTKHTWEVNDSKVMSIKPMLSKQEDTDNFAYMHIMDILMMLKNFKAKHIVLTGGEPCLYDLENLTGSLIANGYSVQIETSGTYPIKCHPKTFITVSPKIGMAGGMEVLQGSYLMANEVKFPVGKPADIIKLKEEVLPYTTGNNNIWLQPLSQSTKATALCVKEATNNGWRVSIQTHKFIGVR